ncbi:MAG: zinc-dependent alcohol dehydrogenase family protein [Nitrospirota bacterium]|nr:MAG: zinc-dependent alcohol dehydrogenase family protein [Nitrospirota bacterium]
MKAMLLETDGDITTNPLKIHDLPIPLPGPGQVRVKVHVCGVCRTDLHVVEGELPASTRPIIPGHETVGIVDQLGPGVTQFKKGDRVGIAWLQSTCQICQFCQSGRENLCERAMFTGYHVNGGYAEYALVSERFTYPIPDIFSDEEAAPLLCAGIIGYRALRRSQVQPGQRLGLYGFGASAHITIQIARHWGCEVYVCSLREEHRNLARQLGAVWVGEASDMPPETLHSAIMFAPAGELVPPALRALEKGGTLAVAGIYLTSIPSLDYTLDLFHERTLQSVTANTRQDGLDLLREAAAIPIRTHTTSLPLEHANIALQELKAGTIQGAAVLSVSS